jgi:hypothetical protein
MFGPRQPRKIYACYRQTVPAGSDINRGSSNTLGVDSTFGGIRPRTVTRSEDLHLEGRCQHCAWAIAARISSRNPAQADGLTSRSVTSASCPPRTSAWPQQPDSGVGLASGRPGQVPAAAATPPRPGKSPASGPTKFLLKANSASVHADTAASGSGSS